MQVLGSLSGVQSLSMAIGPLIFNNAYAFLTGTTGIHWMEHHLHYIISEKSIWYLGIAMLGAAAATSVSLPDPRNVYVPGADENLSISNTEVARRIRESPDLKVRLGGSLLTIPATSATHCPNLDLVYFAFPISSWSPTLTLWGALSEDGR